jgi:hypothetical protein
MSQTCNCAALVARFSVSKYVSPYSGEQEKEGEQENNFSVLINVQLKLSI